MLTHTHRPSARPLLAALAALLMALGLFTTSPALAADGKPGSGKAAWAVQPGGADGGSERSQFVYTLKPGSVLRDYVNVLNTGRKPVVLDLYTVDAFNIPADGGFALRNPEEARTGVGGWVRLGKKSRVRIAPGKGLRVPFEVTVPENAEPGDHAGAIVAANARLERGTKKKGDVAFDVRRRVGARIYLRVEGPLEPGLSVSDFDTTADAPLIPYVTGDGHVAVDWSVTNSGNVRLDPQATLELVGPFGVVDEIDIEVPELLPGGVMTGTSELAQLPPYGKLSARLVVSADEADDSASHTLWSVPWLPLLALGLLAGAWWLRRRHRKGRWPFGSRPAAPVVSETDPEPVAVP